MARLAISKDLLIDFSKLEKRAQNRVAQLADMFQRMTPRELNSLKGVHLEPYTGGRDPRARTVRIDDNHRGVVLDLGDDDTYVLTRIGSHDEVDRWMMQHVSRVNEVTGAFEILNLTEIEAAVAGAPDAPSAEVGVRPLFDHRSDKDFRQLGVDVEFLPVLRVLTDEDQLQSLLKALPQNQAEALILLTGDEPADLLFGQIAGDVDPAKVDIDDLVGALEAPASQAQFHVFTDQDELVQVLALPLAQWRTYLHTSQKQLAHRPSYSGPVRVTGGAGTGKTVVAMHRAKVLADREPAEPAPSILFTTFTRNLAQVIERDLRLLGGGGLLERIDVLNVDSFAYRVVQEAEGGRPQIIDDDGIKGLWQDVVDEHGIGQTAEFLHSEWEQVILAQGCTARAEYFNATRSGRGLRLDRRGRAEVWKAVELLNQRLVDSGRRTFLQLAQAAAGYLATRPVKPYHHVVVDEAQDLHEQQWRLLRAAVPVGPDDMFIVGDSHQRIYDRRSSLSKVGINIVGRSHRLRINYRTTHEILGWALSLLGEGKFDDLDDGPDNHDFAGYHSLLHGDRPSSAGFRSRREQYEALAKQVRRWVDHGVAPEEIGIAVRARVNLDPIRDAIRTTAHEEVVQLSTEAHAGEGVRIGTMHRMKGLEFRCVAVADVDDDNVPAHWDLTDRFADEVQYRADVHRELCLLYVACTRAREHLWVGWSGKPSRFLEPVL